jgi:hypothetical protein
LIHIAVSFILFFSIGSTGLCLGNERTNSKSVLLITFGSGSDRYSNNTPSSFNFSTKHNQTCGPKIDNGAFGFTNAVPNNMNHWHNGELDHTPNDTNGYMLVVNVNGQNGSLLFNSTANDLCIGQCYEFSAYLVNIDKGLDNRIKPNVRFEVRALPAQKNLLAQIVTGGISQYNNMTWAKYGLSFIASNSSVVLLMISNAQGHIGNNIAMDDIELRVCSTAYPNFCPSGTYIYCSLRKRSLFCEHLNHPLHFNCILSKVSIEKIVRFLNLKNNFY